MKKTGFISAILSGVLFLSGAAFADGDATHSNACPSAYQTQIDGEFGSGTSAITTCITKRDDLKIVLNLSTNVLNPKSVAAGAPLSQGLNNALLLVANFKNVYGINIGEDLKVNVVAHFQGGAFLLNSAPQASHDAVVKLLAAGVHFYMCQNTMRANGWTTADLIPGVEEVPAGVVALTDFAQRGYAVITP